MQDRGIPTVSYELKPDLEHDLRAGDADAVLGSEVKVSSPPLPTESPKTKGDSYEDPY